MRPRDWRTAQGQGCTQTPCDGGKDLGVSCPETRSIRILVGLSCPRKTGDAAEITGKPGGTRRRVGAEVPDSEWPGEIFIKDQ